MIKFFDISRQNALIGNEIKEAIGRVIDSCQYVSGKEVEKFEQDFATFCGARYCVALNSGTAALHLALKMVRGHRVVTSANTFIASSSAITMAGKEPEFVDTDPDTCNINVNQVNSKTFKEKLRIVLPISLYGNPVELDKIDKSNDTKIIHDACQAVGAKINFQPICNFADTTCFSFYTTKNLSTCGESGALVTNDFSLYEYAKSLRNHGRKDTNPYSHQYIGYNYRMTEINAAILNVKLKYLFDWNCKRIDIANRYRLNLSGNSNIKLLKILENHQPVYHLFPVFVDNPEYVKKELKSIGVETARHYPIPVHKQDCYYREYGNWIIPQTQKQAATVLTLPIYPELTLDEVDEVSSGLIKILK